MAQYDTIDALILSKGVKINHIAKELGVTTPTLRKLRRDPSLLTVENITKLAAALDVDLQVVIDTALKQEHDQKEEE